MKKVLFAMALFAIPMSLLSSASAQGRFDAAISAGLNIGQIDGDGAGRYNHPGLRAGVATSFALGSNAESPWRMVVEVAFAQKGSVVNTGYDHRNITLNYVELPLMMSYNFLNNRARLAIGLAPAVLAGASVNDDGVENQPLADTYRRFDLLPLIASVRYRFSDHLCLETRFENSMLSISNRQGTGTYRIFRDNKGTFSRLLSFGLAWQF